MKHLLTLTAVVAAFFALVKFHDAYGNVVSLVLLVALWGVGMAAAPLLAIMASFARQRDMPAAAAAVALMAAISAANTAFAVSQTSYRMANMLLYVLWFLVESAVVAVSVLRLRRLGFRLTVAAAK